MNSYIVKVQVTVEFYIEAEDEDDAKREAAEEAEFVINNDDDMVLVEAKVLEVKQDDEWDIIP